MTKDELDKIPDRVFIDGDWETREVHIDGKRLNPARSQKLRNHSPDGFNWGYGGSGPAQFALAILLHFINEEEALNNYQQFKFSIVAAWPQADFELTVPIRKIISELISNNKSQQIKLT